MVMQGCQNLPEDDVPVLLIVEIFGRALFLGQWPRFMDAKGFLGGAEISGSKTT
jgi:hypothetical protein